MIAGTLTGCATHWAGGYQVQEKRKDHFEVWYDPTIVSQALMQLEVKKYCETFNATPEIVSATHGWGIVTNKEVYRCVDK
jgi:hypothetical protein